MSFSLLTHFTLPPIFSLSLTLIILFTSLLIFALILTFILSPICHLVPFPGGCRHRPLVAVQCNPNQPFRNLQTIEEIEEFTQRFNEKLLLKSFPTLPMSDEESSLVDSEEDYAEESQPGTAFEQEMALLDDENEMLLASFGLTEAQSTRSLTATSATGLRASLSSLQTVGSRPKKKKRVMVGLANAEQLKYRRETDLRVPEFVRPPLRRFRLEVVSSPCPSPTGRDSSPRIPATRNSVASEV
ncbi:unnamed protein product [Protopolystoma xenopodis]|uniref:Uncharacterized protein n=1 Tax=Protopolystoma xenopodis TaxID=117903 RepID=A0A3S5B4P8_9PLAT|nr:unnamed protein product [Protopolystoma xenopodis]